MRMRGFLWAVLAASGLTLGGCGKANTAPPPVADTDTPTVDINEGDIVAPDEVTPSEDTTSQTEESGAAQQEGE